MSKEFKEWFFGSKEELDETLAYIKKALIAGFFTSSAIALAFIFWLEATGL